MLEILSNYKKDEHTPSSRSLRFRQQIFVLMFRKLPLYPRLKSEHGRSVIKFIDQMMTCNSIEILNFLQFKNLCKDCELEIHQIFLDQDYLHLTYPVSMVLCVNAQISFVFTNRIGFAINMLSLQPEWAVFGDMWRDFILGQTSNPS